ncbi:MAG: nucleotidyltransferase domain-containing protein [Candidatus Tritonobacter lacicola]|nr:nucleotidyltransferase domain-containing protein [Candidatus Tritonobacter lacicola]
MNFTQPLDHILGQLSKIMILRFMIHARLPMNGREIAKAVGLSHVRCHTILKELSEQGIITLRKIGRSTVYELQHDHIVVKHWLKPLFREEKQLKKRLARTVTKHLSVNPVSVILFGSIARKEDRLGSDIDMLLIMPGRANLKKCKRELSGAEEAVTQLYGNHLSPLLMKHNLFITKLKREDPFLKEVLRDGQQIYGKTIPELLSNES